MAINSSPKACESRSSRCRVHLPFSARRFPSVSRRVSLPQPARLRGYTRMSGVLSANTSRAHHPGDRVAVAQAKPGKADTSGLHHQFFRMRSSAQEGEVRSGGKFEITHYSSASGKRPVQEPRRRTGAMREVAVESGAEQPESKSAFVLDAEVIARRPAVLAPPDA